MITEDDEGNIIIIIVIIGTAIRFMMEIIDTERANGL